MKPSVCGRKRKARAISTNRALVDRYGPSLYLPLLSEIADADDQAGI